MAFAAQLENDINENDWGINEKFQRSRTPSPPPLVDYVPSPPLPSSWADIPDPPYPGDGKWSPTVNEDALAAFEGWQGTTDIWEFAQSGDEYYMLTCVNIV
jgi:hypothetical protein